MTEFVKVKLSDLEALKNKVSKYKATIRNLIKEVKYLREIIEEYNSKYVDKNIK